MGILDLKDYGPENNRGYRNVLVVNDNFSKSAWTIPLKNKNAQITKHSFGNILMTSKKNLNETDRGKEFYNNIFQNFLNNNRIKIYSRKNSLGSVFSERFKKSIGNLLKRHVFGKGDGNWLDVLPTITTQYNNRVHSSTKITPM